MTETPVIYRRDGPVARITFNRPQMLNAIDSQMATLFLRACREVAADAEVRAVVVSGEGRAFMAGGDIAQFRDDPQSVPSSLIDPMHEGLKLLGTLQAPVIASVQGAAAGAGMSIALACDLVIAAEGTRFNSAYVNLATSCDLGASWSLPRVVGLRRALEIMLLSETIDAARALELGLVNRVVPADELVAETEKLVNRLVSGAPIAQGVLKRLMRESFGREFSAQLAAERKGFEACVRTADFREGVAAFLDKRPADFRGH
jgi:2-(1,2-epoxy-1,2-dihydrophenyl)acetyl-CoA isomerase